MTRIHGPVALSRAQLAGVLLALVLVPAGSAAQPSSAKRPGAGHPRPRRAAPRPLLRRDLARGSGLGVHRAPLGIPLVADVDANHLPFASWTPTVAVQVADWSGSVRVRPFGRPREAPAAGR